MKKRTLILSTLLLMITLVCASAIIIYNINKTPPENKEELLWDVFEEKEYEKEIDYLYNENDSVWKDFSMAGWQGVMYNGIQYCYCLENNKDVKEEFVELDSKTTQFEFTTTPEPEAPHTADGLYKVKGVSEKYMVAVKLDDYYIKYYNTEYEPESLGQYLNDIGIGDKIEVLDLKIILKDDFYEVEKVLLYYDDLNEKFTELLLEKERKRVYDDEGYIYWNDTLFSEAYIRVKNTTTNEIYTFMFTDKGNLYVITFEGGEFIFQCGLDELEEFLKYFADEVEGYMYKGEL